MNKTKLVIVGLLVAYSIYVAISLVTSDISGLLKSNLGWMQIMIMFPIVFAFCSLIWTWLLPKFSKRLRDPNYKAPFPSMKNKLSESPYEWIYLLALFFIIPSISLELSIILGHGEFYGIGFIGIAYGLGLLGSIYLIRKRKRNSV